jgi:hypothetical protein
MIETYVFFREAPMPMTTSHLRQDIYRILDQVLETGVPVEILRRGRILRIVAEEPRSKLDNLVVRETMVDDPEEYVHIDWSGEWTP